MIAALVLAGCVRIEADERELRQPIWVDVSTGGESTCAVRTDGTIRCWADAASVSDWQAVTPSGDGFEQISVGYRHACALDGTDGSSVCFGNSLVIDGAEDDEHPGPLASLDVGVDKACGVSEGELVCWDYETNWDELPALPAGTLDDYAVRGDGCAIVDGVLTCWGTSGRTPDLEGNVAVKVAMGDDNAVCVVDDTSTVWCSDTSTPSRPIEQLATGLVDVEVLFDGFGCGLDADGAIACFGLIPDVFADIPGGTGWHDLTLGDDVACAVSAEGFLGCWGDRDDPRFPQ